MGRCVVAVLEVECLGGEEVGEWLGDGGWGEKGVA